MALSGKTIVFTGALMMQRKIAASLAEKAGATVGSSVTNNTDIVVAGPDAINTAKVTAAKAKGVTIWTEQDFGKGVMGKGAPKAASAKDKAKAKAKAAPKASPAKSTPKKSASSESVGLKKKASSGAVGQSATKKAKGAKVVDREVPGRDNRSVYQDFAIKLNQTNVGGNNNKFYIIQVLEGDGKFFTWNRWGRVGEPGQN